MSFPEIEKYAERTSRFEERKNCSEIAEFVCGLDGEINSKDVQVEIFRVPSEYFCVFSKFCQFLLREFQGVYLQIEKLIIEWVGHPCLIISNFAVLLLIHISSFLPCGRVSQLTEYFLNEALSENPIKIQYLRYLAAVADLPHCFSQLFKEKKFETAALLAENSKPSEKIFNFVKLLLQNTVDSSIEIHWVFSKVSGLNNAVHCFKNFASKLWVLSNSQKLRKNDCISLLEYCGLPWITGEIGDLEVLKSLIFSLNMTFEYLNTVKDQDFAERVEVIIENIKLIEVGERYKGKIKESISRITQKLENDYTRPSPNKLSPQALVAFGESLCKHRLDLIPPILSLQKLLKINSKISLSNYSSVLQALQEITNCIKSITKSEL